MFVVRQFRIFGLNDECHVVAEAELDDAAYDANMRSTISDAFPELSQELGTANDSGTKSKGGHSRCQAVEMISEQTSTVLIFKTCQLRATITFANGQQPMDAAEVPLQSWSDAVEHGRGGRMDEKDAPVEPIS